MAVRDQAAAQGLRAAGPRGRRAPGNDAGEADLARTASYWHAG